MSIRRAITMIVLASILATAPSIGSRTPVAAAAGEFLGLGDFGRILVDASTSHVFVSSPGSSAIVVTDLNGTIVKTITGEAGAYGMALNGNSLYVVLSTGGAIHRIDTGTLQDTAVLATGLVRPTDLVYAGSKLWTTTGNCQNWSVELVSIDPAASTPTLTHYPGVFNTGNDLSYCAQFASNPTLNPGSILAFSFGVSPATLTTFDVSSGSPVQTRSAPQGILQNLRDVAVNPDGAHFVTASGYPYEFDEWNVSNLQQDGIIYPANTYPTAVATTPALGGLMGGGLNGVYDPDFYAYQIGHPAAHLAKVDFGGTGNTVPDRGIAFSPDGSRAFVISGSAPTLNIVPIAATGSPSEPGTPVASPGVDSATVTWTPPTNTGNSAVSSYTVSASPGGRTVTTTATSVAITGLAPGTSYSFTVTARNAAGAGLSSAASNAVVPWACSPPTGVSALPGDTDAFVTWQPPADPGSSPVTAYRITPYFGSIAQQPVTTVTGSPPPTDAIVTGLTNGRTYTFVVTGRDRLADGQDSAPSNAVTPIQGGNYHSLAPKRILDTRTTVGGSAMPLGNGAVRTVQITGKGGVPTDGVSAVVMNVTVTNATSAGYLTVYPNGAPKPTASNLNFVGGQTVPNLVEVALGNGGQVNVAGQYITASGHADVIFDVAGWVGDATNAMAKQGLFNALTPARIMDTRDGTGVRKGRVGTDQMVTLNVLTHGVPATGVSAVVLNVTVTNPTAASYLTVYPADAAVARPTVSNLNFRAGQTVPNRVIVKVGTGGMVNFYNALGDVDVIADVNGWFTDGTSSQGGARFTGVLPKRMLDSRDPTIGPVQAGHVYPVQFTDQYNNPITGVSALVFNVTVTNPTSSSFLTLWPDGPPLPPVSDLNFVAGQTVPNLVVVKLGQQATIDLYNALGQTDVVLDLVGFYGDQMPAPNGAARSSGAAAAAPGALSLKARPLIRR